MAATLNAEDIALILAAIEGSLVLPMKTDVTARPTLAQIEASTVLALEASVQAVPTLAEIEASTVLAKTANLSALALETSVQAVPTAAENADAVWDELSAEHAISGSEGTKLASVAPAAIASAVWDEMTADHAIVGSVGAAVVVVQASTPPTTTAIANAVWAKEIVAGVAASAELDTVYQGYIAGAAPGAGPGAIAFTETVNVAGVPADGVEVWVTTDEGGTNIIAGTLVTNASGQAVFMLDAGTYYIWKQKSGDTFTNPETIVVS